MRLQIPINRLTFVSPSVNKCRRLLPVTSSSLPPVSYVVPSLEDDEPDEKSTGYEGQDAGGHLKAPREPETVRVWIASHPEVLALETKGIVSKDHDRHHQKHS